MRYESWEGNQLFIMRFRNILWFEVIDGRSGIIMDDVRVRFFESGIRDVLYGELEEELEYED
jgi:hypothetical protein